MYGDKVTTLDRIKQTITQKLPTKVRLRLVLENDEVRVREFLTLSLHLTDRTVML